MQVINDPNSYTSNVMKRLSSLEAQRKKFSQYDKLVSSFKSDPAEDVIEDFFTFRKFMFDKIIVILIIGLLAIFIMEAMEFI